MASKQHSVDFVLDQIAGAGDVSARKMFGEYGVYCDGKFVAVVCDDIFYVKPTEEGRAFAGDIEEAPPYPGAKDYLLVTNDLLEDADWAAELVRITTATLPTPKPKKTKAKKKKAAVKKAK